MITMSNNRPSFPARGQIYLYDLGTNAGCVQDGKRPVLVLTPNEICRTSPVVTVAPITSVLKRTDLPGHILLPETEALEKPSMLVLEQIRTVNVSDLGHYCGMLRGNDTWIQINNGIKKMLGLWHKPREYSRPRDQIQTVTCLCQRCVSFYWDNPAYKIKRLTPPNGVKDKCDRCGYHYGFDYLITEQRGD